MEGWDDSTDTGTWLVGTGSGTVMLRVGVRDDDGLWAFDTCRINYNSAPAGVDILWPVNGDTLKEGFQENARQWRLLLQWNGIDSDRPLDTLLYRVHVNPATEIPGSACYIGRDTAVTVNLDTAILYRIIVRAEDSMGDTVWSDSVMVYSPIPLPLPAMVSIPGGAFQMGGTLRTDGLPVHNVTVSSFKMSTTHVTQEMYLNFMGVNPSWFKCGGPVERVTWDDAVLFCNKLSRYCGRDPVYSYSGIQGVPGDGCTLGDVTINLSNNGFRLPTEAEWEYACRAGSTTDYYWGRNYPISSHADSVAADANAVWRPDYSGCQTKPVAGRSPNAWGLYDMAGNVEQWCNDTYETYNGNDQTDPIVWHGSPHVLRGGYYSGSKINICSAFRNYMSCGTNCQSDHIGFRIVCRP